MVSFTHEQNSIYRQKLSQKQLNNIAHEHTIICRQLFCRSHGGLLADEKEETFASNDNN